MNWSAQIPDFNPIENLCDQLDPRIEKCNNRSHTKSVKELACLLQTEWKKIPLSIIQTFVESMPRRVKAVIASGRGSINY
ncbi:transposable element tcb1 transposase [Trichonephila clavipes]|nr:transposable element tcb1 transposase [Trichonephila clavipes]